jgi:hypothetical protein
MPAVGFGEDINLISQPGFDDVSTTNCTDDLTVICFKSNINKKSQLFNQDLRS